MYCLLQFDLEPPPGVGFQTNNKKGYFSSITPDSSSNSSNSEGRSLNESLFTTTAMSCLILLVRSASEST